MDLDRPVYAVGLTDPNPPWNDNATLQEIARYFADALRDAERTDPPHILGYSFGGMLAYEVARQLQEANFAVGLLLIVDTGPEQFQRKFAVDSLCEICFASSPMCRHGS